MVRNSVNGAELGLRHGTLAIRYPATRTERLRYGMTFVNGTKSRQRYGTVRYRIRLRVRSGCRSELIRLTTRSLDKSAERLQYEMNSVNGAERLRYGINAINITQRSGTKLGQRYGTGAVRNKFS